MRVAVAGGTGVVGRHVVSLLRERGSEPVVLARSQGVDLLTGAGLEQQLTGVEAVVDLSKVTTTSRRRSIGFFTGTTGRLLEAGRRAGVRHHVALSIVGVERVELGYYAGKRAQEQLVLTGPVPGSVLRATQFHEFAGQLLDRVRGPVAVIPRMLVQPVAACEVARALVDLAAAPPVGMAPELAGPQELELVELADGCSAHAGHAAPSWAYDCPGVAGAPWPRGRCCPPARDHAGSRRSTGGSTTAVPPTSTAPGGLPGRDAHGAAVGDAERSRPGW